MAKRKIYMLPEDEKFLRQKSRPVKKISRRVERLLQALVDTLNGTDGVGLAAPQIGTLLRVAIIVAGLDPDKDVEEQETFIVPLINPVIVEEGPYERAYDGCLSAPGLQGYTERPQFLRVHSFDVNGELIEYTFRDFDAKIVHHEIDHLNGVLYFDRIKTFDDLFYLVEDDEDEEKIKFLPYLEVHPEFRQTPNRRTKLPTRGVRTIFDK